MRFIIDAQLPRQLARELAAMGHDAVHTMDLPLKNRTPDRNIIALSISENRTVVTKDKDFYLSFTLHKIPPKLLLITTGNITNRDLQQLMIENLKTIVPLFESYSFLELTREQLIVHE
ncbi:MAG TPA: DUF5615 family PIN-like protein [Candidatus Kapabacteria bacterium]|jgi:predicted nuclease of predicted toxin-antitoxin system|nr:DUF5615 family PIN-like protein [Candidatus Kapabacteria bacterium]